MFYDTHAHYDDEAFDQDRDILLPELHRQGITLINDIGCDIPSSKKAISIAEQYPFVYAVVGAWPACWLPALSVILTLSKDAPTDPRSFLYIPTPPQRPMTVMMPCSASVS